MKKADINTTVDSTTIVAAQMPAVAQTTAVTQNHGMTSVEGFENLDLAKELKYPRLKLMQKMSPELDENESLRPGQLVNSVTLEQVSATFIPLMISKSNIFFVPRETDKWAPILQAIPTLNKEELDGEMTICRALDAKVGDRFGSCASCPYNKFQGNTAPMCNETINVMVLFDGDMLPSILSFSVTSLKHGKSFVNLSYMKAMKEGALFASKYKWTPKKNSNKQGDWFELTIQPVAEKPSEDEIALAREMYLMVKDYNAAESELAEAAAAAAPPAAAESEY